DLVGGNKELTIAFDVMYAAGCVLAAAAVRYRNLFTALVMPPLLLFVAVPVAYWFLSGGKANSIKDILLNQAMPLVHRFPTMLAATVGALVVAGFRFWRERQAERSRRGDAHTAHKGRGAQRSKGARRENRDAMRQRRRDDFDERGYGDDGYEDPPPSARRESRRRKPEPSPRAASRSRNARKPGVRRPEEHSRGTRRRSDPPPAQPVVRYREPSREPRR
ncbi:MAG: hypothetical protein J2P17_23970, partial [Mycobacterium sp.]|nr:hypothetical protein [Mycobacterium sp.]